MPSSGTVWTVAAFTALVQPLGVDLVGVCLGDEQVNDENGDQLQRTTQGLLVRTASDATLAFTDGQSTWRLCGEEVRGNGHNPVLLGWTPRKSMVLPGTERPIV